MFFKDLRVELLMDFYGEILNEHTRRILERYYADDLSLGEIAEEEGLSRQGVRHIIKKGEETLFFMEDKLGLAEKETAKRETAEELLKIGCSLSHDPEERVHAAGEKIVMLAERFLSGE